MDRGVDRNPDSTPKELCYSACTTDRHWRWCQYYMACPTQRTAAVDDSWFEYWAESNWKRPHAVDELVRTIGRVKLRSLPGTLKYQHWSTILRLTATKYVHSFHIVMLTYESG